MRRNGYIKDIFSERAKKMARMDEIFKGRGFLKTTRRKAYNPLKYLMGKTRYTRVNPNKFVL